MPLWASGPLSRAFIGHTPTPSRLGRLQSFPQDREPGASRPQGRRSHVQGGGRGGTWLVPLPSFPACSGTGSTPNSLLLSEPHNPGPRQAGCETLVRGENQPKVQPKSKELETRDEHPPGFRLSLQLRRAPNRGRQLWGRARGLGEALTASAASGLRGADRNLQGGNVSRRRGGEALGQAAQPQRCPAGWAGAGAAQRHARSPGQDAGAARRGVGGGRQGALRCEAGAPGTRVAPGWRREQAEREPGQGQRGKRQGADEIQEEEEVDEDEAGPPAGSGGGGGGGGREKRLAGS